MSFFRLPLLKPTIKLKASTRQRFAIYGHIVSIVGGFFMVVSGVFSLFSSDFLSFFGLLGGIFILLIEFDEIPFPPLKEAVVRGIFWMLLGAFSFVHYLAIIMIFVGGGCYLAYHLQ